MNKAFITFICILNLVHVMIHLASSSKESTMIRDWHTIHFDTIRFGRVLPVTMIVSLPFFFFFDFFFDFFWFFFYHGPSDKNFFQSARWFFYRSMAVPTFTVIPCTSTTDGAQSYVEVPSLVQPLGQGFFLDASGDTWSTGGQLLRWWRVVLHTRLLQWQIHHEHKTVDKVKPPTCGHWLRLRVASLCLPPTR